MDLLAVEESPLRYPAGRSFVPGKAAEQHQVGSHALGHEIELYRLDRGENIRSESFFCEICSLGSVTGMPISQEAAASDSR